MRKCSVLVAAITMTVGLLGHGPARAGDIIADWGSVKMPSPPELKPATLDGKTTALLILDLQKPSCTKERRVRCVDTIPKVKALLDRARGAGAMVFYTFAGGRGNPSEIADPGLAPREGEWVAQRGPDKFLGSDLEKRLKDRGIKSVIVTGSSAAGVVFGTGSGAAQRGYQVIVPVDGMSSDEAFAELYTAWHLTKGGPEIVTSKVTLTRSDMIKF
jgi:nicotinamidase-related amidase